MPPGSEDFPPLGGFPPLGLGPVSKSKAKAAGKSKAPAPSEPPPGELSQAAPPKKAPAPPPKKASPEVLPKAPPKAAVEAATAQPLSKKAVAAQAPPKAPPQAPAEAASASAEAPQRFGADDYELAAEADAAANAAIVEVAETEDRLNLDIPPLALGKKAVRTLRLVSNHFHLSVRSSGNATVWRCWRVDFVKMEKDKDPNAKKMPKKKGDDEREVPKGLRKQAVEMLLKDIPHTDWLHDGNNLLYTRKTVTSLQDQRKEVEVPSTKPGGRPFPLTLEVKFEGREIDLGWLHQPQVDKTMDPAEAMASMSEHRRFVQVAIRTLAQEREELIAQGRKVICADNRLICDAVPLKYGRQMWFGYIGQVEIVNGGPGVGGRLNPARATLSLNLVASVGLPDMSVIDLLGKLGAKRPGDWYSEEECKKDVVWNYWDRRYTTMRDSLRGELGLRKLRVRAEYGQVKVKGKLVYGLTDKPANRYQFDCEEMGGKVDVAAYFKHKHGLTLKHPDLPCIQLGNARNCIPMEYVYVMGGEHNLAVGKLRPEFQQEVTRRTAMQPSARRDQIMQALNNTQLGPSAALKPKGVDVAFEMLAVTGRLLDTPKLRDGSSAVMRDSTNYSNNFKTLAPPKFNVSWGLWTFTTERSPSERDIQWFADQLTKRCYSKGMNFSDAKFVEWPEEAFNSYFRCHKNREAFSPEMGNVIRKELNRVATAHKDLKLLVILLDNSEAITDHLYKLVKLITETEMGTFTTQFVNCKKGIEDAEKKLNNLMLKITPKLPEMPTGCRAAHNVALSEPHPLLRKEEATMIMGADVTHKVAGISVAGVVGSADSSYASYFHQIRGQSPYTLNTLKQRNRQSEERIIDLTSMTFNILEKWRSMNKKLPDTIIYYRDGVSDGQFINVLKRELNLLDDAFKKISTTYDPKLVIIVGQKRHQTRLWMQDGGLQDDKGKGKGKDKGKDDKGKGKGKGKDTAQVPPGTVASEGIAQPSHLNFFLVSQLGIQGTSVPCHYHILHLDKRLVKKGITVDDFETITFQLCHMYSRADKSVGYATPAYMADHVCERGKHYLEANFGSSDVMSTHGSSVSEEKQDENLRKQIEERTSWLNDRAAQSSRLNLNGLQLYC